MHARVTLSGLQYLHTVIKENIYIAINHLSVLRRKVISCARDLSTHNIMVNLTGQFLISETIHLGLSAVYAI